MSDRYHELLYNYSGYIRRSGHIEAAAMALRTRSKAMQDVIAYVATYEKLNRSELQASLCSDSHMVLLHTDLRFEWLATLGRVVSLQSFHEADSDTFNENILFGLKCLQIANRHLPIENEYQHFHRLEVELLMHTQRLEEASQLIEKNEFLKNFYYGYLACDLKNAAVAGDKDLYTSWLEGFNRPFVENNLVPVAPSNNSTHVFNDLRTVGGSKSVGGPKVSVIMTSYEPQPKEFLLAVESILQQTWQNLELLIVDDASPSGYNDILERAGCLDSRVRVIRLAENGGTYRARNVGVRVATGDYITGQDSDDWSHPERLYWQIDYLEKHHEAPGVVVEAIRMDDQLVRTFPGRLPNRLCEVSLMIPTNLARSSGGYLDARKGADSEFRRRLEKLTAKRIATVEKPLYLTRIGRESLSGADFKPGWSHPVRRAFWNATQFWHDVAIPSELRLSDSSREPLPVPSKFKINPPSHESHVDILFVGDWRTYSRDQRVMLDEISVLSSQGYRLGILHLESILSPSKEPTRLAPEVQNLINSGRVMEVLPDSNTASELTIVNDPTILQFCSTEDTYIASKRTLISANIPPAFDLSDKVVYLPTVCTSVAESLFGGTVVWSSSDPAIHASLKKFDEFINVHSEAVPIAFLPESWGSERKRLTTDRPILGRHAENHGAVWPRTAEMAVKLWPVDDAVEVRVLGDARGLLRKYKKARFPTNWVVYRDQEIFPQAFMNSIDFFVYVPDENYPQKFCREALEAAASGALVILPKQFSHIHDDTAVCASGASIPEVINQYFTNPTMYYERVASVRRHLEEIFINADYSNFIRNLIVGGEHSLQGKKMGSDAHG